MPFLSIVRRKPIFWFLACLVVYKLIFNTFTANFLTPLVSKQIFQKPVHIRWERFSLFFGFGIRDLKISEEEEQKKEILSVSHFRLYYNLPYLFLGHVKISEITIENLELNLHKKNGIWNVSQIFIPSNSTAPTPQETKSLEELSTFVPISLFAKINFTDAKIYLEDEDEGQSGEFEIPNLSLHLETHRKNKFPLSMKIIEVPKVFSFVLGEEEKVYKFLYKNKNSTLSTGITTFLKVFKEKEDQPIYSSKLIFQTKDLKIESGKEQIQTSAELKYQINFLENSESLSIDEFLLKVDKSTNMQARGIVKDLFQSQEFSIQIEKLFLNLIEIGNLLQKSNLVNFSISGILDFPKLLIQGTAKELKIELNAIGKNLFFKNYNQAHLISSFQLNSQANLDLVNETKFFPYIKTLLIQPLELNYNSAFITLVGDISDSIHAKLEIRSFSINQFVKILGGKLNGAVEVDGNIQDLKTNLTLNWLGFQFLESSFKTNHSNINARLNGSLSFDKDFSLEKISLSSSSINLFNILQDKALGLDGDKLTIEFSPLRLKVGQISLAGNLRKITPILPLNYSNTIADLRSTIGDEVFLFSSFNLNLEKGTKINGIISPRIPHLSLNDLKFDMDTHIDFDGNGSININKLLLNGFNGNLKGFTKGRLIKKAKGYLGDFEPYLESSLQLSSASNVKLTPNLGFSGNMGIALNFEKNFITGKLYSEQSNFMIETGKCPGNECKLFLLEGFQMNVPIQHDLNIRSEISLLIEEKSKLIQNNPISESYNLSLKRVVGSHPFRENTAVEYIKQIGNEAGLKGRLDYHQNIFRLENLKINSLNGFIYGKNIFLNLQPAFLNKLEYSAILQVRDIDLKELLKPSVAKKIDDGKITADINISGRNFVEFLENVHVFFSVYKIGRDFGKSALNVIMSSNLLQDYIINSYSVDKIELELSRGLVYADVLFKPGILPTLFVRVENNRITQERVPISSFITRAQNEIRTYE